MQYRGKKYEEAILKLKEMNANYKMRRLKEFKDQYHSFMKKICDEFSISEKTVYRDMIKPVPGLRKNRNDRGKFRTKITEEEILKAEEIIMAGKSKKTVKEKLEVSNRKMKRINEKLEDTKNDKRETEETRFGFEAKEFFNKLFEIELIAPGKGIKLVYNDVNFIVSKDDLNDIILILSNAYNRACFSDNKKLKVSRDELRNMMMQQLVEDQMKLAQSSRDYKMIEAITRMRERMNENATLPDDFETILKVCKELKPDLSKEDLIGLIKKVSSGH
jgi:hypothetical protein